MAAGLEGAGPDQAFGINIRLPFEQGANQFIADDPKLVSMKYFFTRKLLLIKESFGYAVLPGGFGTLDEAFELLTLIQTGKAEPAPVVLLEVPGRNYWKAWERFVTEDVAIGRLGRPRTRLYRMVTTRGGRRRRDPRLLPQLPLPSLGRRHPGPPARGAPTDDEVARLCRGYADPSSLRSRYWPGALHAERRTDDFQDKAPGWGCASTGSPTPACASSSTP